MVNLTCYSLPRFNNERMIMKDGMMMLLIPVTIAICMFDFYYDTEMINSYIKEKQHADKTVCEYIEQAPCKIIYIKDEE